MNTTKLFLSLAVVIAISAVASAGIDPRGPIDNPGIAPVVDAEGVHSPGFKFDPKSCAKPAPWQAKWIWLPIDTSKAAATAYRKEITLADVPKHVAAWLSADTKYRLYINGRLAARGPVDIGRDYAGGSTERWFYDYRELTQFFQKGKNTIAIEVFHHWPIGFTVSRGHPGLIFEAEVSLPDGSKQTIASDPTWKAAPADWFSAAGGLTYDAAREPQGWRMPVFDDSAWKPCEFTPDIWSPLIPSEIPPLMEARYPILRIDNVHGSVTVPAAAAKTGRGIAVTGDGSFTVVFDRVLSAYPTIKLKGGKGTRVTIHSTRQSQFVASGGETCYESPFMDEIAPAFTVIFAGVTDPITIEDVGANFTSQPVDYVGSFECSDEKLNKIWKASRWAVQICMQTHHLDSPNHQEPICDPGDMVIEAQVSYYAFGQPWLARQDIRKFAWLLKNEKYRCFHTSYALYWLEMLTDYAAYTGNESLIKEMRPYVYELLDTYASWIGKNGLVSEAPNYMFMDWVEIGGFGCHHPPAVIGQGYLTALYAGALTRAGLIAIKNKDMSRDAEYEAASQRISIAFNRDLWVNAKGLYRDGKAFQTSVKPGQWLPADKDIETFSPHVNLLAVLYGLTSYEKRRAVVEKVISQEPLNTQPWFMHWVFAAIERAGLFDKYGASQLRRFHILPETQSFQEMWNGGDRSHGWCSTPLVQMSSQILGVRFHGRSANGRESIWIVPHFCDLASAKGKVPTPNGVISVSWKADGNQRIIDIDIPAKTDPMLCLPVPEWEDAQVTIDGKICKHDPGCGLIGADLDPYTISPGTHHIVLRNGKATNDK